MHSLSASVTRGSYAVRGSLSSVIIGLVGPRGRWALLRRELLLARSGHSQNKLCACASFAAAFACVLSLLEGATDVSEGST